ncbi:conserved hypothetical protein [Neospora caninum Liverpool]|uniref:Uncharacterized protein n=1 Tax=Neospora caninum (strain Liverpool) TaxID=572307 RepID=F0VJS4_NEOCL|nr:conserved hypothetical protein [Neospora caninum Liverpool]CBZ53985.1 conserved hypothetical protein [Neospora caninum Liverpool]CEL67987.1 TPA: hypothetical protein BN1204_037670 [Neospora caninum Liverpool]|eukprot:XP_003884017.1 conserved hypothetical protein [Neospora caninum Liverpool]
MQRHWTKFGYGRARRASARLRARDCSRRHLRECVPTQAASASFNLARDLRDRCGISSSGDSSSSDACASNSDSGSWCCEQATSMRKSADCQAQSPTSSCVGGPPEQNGSPKAGVLSNSNCSSFSTEKEGGFLRQNSFSENGSAPQTGARTSAGKGGTHRGDSRQSRRRGVSSQHAAQWSPLQCEVSKCDRSVLSSSKGTLTQDRGRQSLPVTRLVECPSKCSKRLDSREINVNTSQTESSENEESYDSESTSEASGVSWLDFSSCNKKEMRAGRTITERTGRKSSPVTCGSDCRCLRNDHPETFLLEPSLAPPERGMEVGSSQRLHHKSRHQVNQSMGNSRTTCSRVTQRNRASPCMRKISVSSGAADKNGHHPNVCGSVGNDATGHPPFGKTGVSSKRECLSNIRKELGESVKETLAPRERDIVGRLRGNTAFTEKASHTQSSVGGRRRGMGNLYQRSFHDQMRDRIIPQPQEWEDESCGESELSKYGRDSSLPETPRRRASDCEPRAYGVSEVHLQSNSHSEVDFMEVNGSDGEELPHSRESTDSEYAELPSMSRERTGCKRPPQPLVTRRHFEGRGVNRTAAPTAATPFRRAAESARNLSNGCQGQAFLKKSMLPRGRTEKSPRRLSATSTSPSGNQDVRSDGWSTYTSYEYLEENAYEVPVHRRGTAPGKIRKESPTVNSWSISAPTSSSIVTLEHVNASIDWIVDVGSNPQMIQKVQKIITQRLQTRGFKRQSQSLRLDHEAIDETLSLNYFRANPTRSWARNAAKPVSVRPVQVTKSPNTSSGKGRVRDEQEVLKKERATVLRPSWSTSDVPLLDPSWEAMISVQLAEQEHVALEADKP